MTGIWWKSLFGAWVAARMIGYVLYAFDVEVSRAAGGLLLLGLWAAVGGGLYYWSQRSGRSTLLAPGFAGVFQRLALVFAFVVLMAGGVVATVGESRSGDSAWAALPIAGSGIACALAVRRMMPDFDRTDERVWMEAMLPRFLLQMACAMVPVAASLLVFFLVEDAHAAIYLVGAAFSLLAIGLAVPRTGDAAASPSPPDYPDVA